MDKFTGRPIGGHRSRICKLVEFCQFFFGEGFFWTKEKSKSESICKRIYIDIGFSIDNNTTSSIVNELAQFVGIFHCVDSFISRDERQKDENYRKLASQSSVNKLKNQLSKSTFFNRNSTTAKFLIRRIFVREST